MNRALLGGALVVAAVLAASCGRKQSDPPVDAQSIAPLVVEPRYAPGELLVKFKRGVTSDQAEAMVRAKSAVASRPLGAKAMVKGSKIERWRQVILPTGTDVKTALERYRSDPAVEYAEPNYLIRISAIPDDPAFNLQWALQNLALDEGVYGADIDAVAAWDVETGTPPVVVAVIDTGADIVHEDLAANIWVNAAEIPGNGIDDDQNGYVDDVNGYDFLNNDGIPEDQNGHGTHVAGIIAAVGNSGTGVTGVAWMARVMPLKFAGADGSGSAADAIRAIAYANANGARILNNSWGFYTYSQALRDAIADTDTAGLLFVAAAGNDGQNNDVTPLYPASYDQANIVSVAATTQFDAKASFSNFGRNTVDIGAPGDHIYSLAPQNQYMYRGGTSMAAPHVSGTAALLLSHSPALAAPGLKALLLDRADQNPAMQGITTSGGRLNAHNALDCDLTLVDMGVRAPVEAFTVLGGEPTMLRIQLTRCGRAVTGYNVSAAFNSGEANLELLDDGLHGDGVAGDGIYANMWIPQLIGPIVVSLSATASGEPALTQTRNGQVRQRVRYQHRSVPYNWIDTTSGSAHALANDGSVTLPIGFGFQFYGLSHSTVTVSANGVLMFSSSLPASDNSRLPDPSLPNELIAPFWDDLDPANGAIYTLLEGSAPTRRFTIAWVNVARSGSGGSATFEATLYEGSNDIIFNYQDVIFGDSGLDNGANAVTGVEDPDGLDATVYSDHQRLVENGTARRFYIVPAEPELTYKVTINTSPIRSGSGRLIVSAVDGDGTNNNYFNFLEFLTDGDVVLNPVLNGDAAGSFIPGPAYLGDASFANLIAQPVIFGTQIRFLMRVSRNGLFEPFPDSFALYLLDEGSEPYPTNDPLGTDALFAIEVDRSQPVPQIFQSPYASVSVETVGAPVANAGGPYAGAATQPIAFDGSASSDPESDPLMYAWAFGDGATGTGATPSHAYSTAGQYTVQLIVSDGALVSAPASAQVTVGNGQPPTANAGADSTVDQQVQVTLDGSASTDPDGTIASYAWHQTAGPTVVLSGATSAIATFTSPLVSAATTLSFELTVTDNSGNASKDTVNVSVRKNNLSPVARAGSDQSANEHTSVTLDGAASSDPDGTVSEYQWLQIAGPTAPLTLTSPSTVTFTAPSVSVDTVLTFQLTVTDNQGATASDTVSVTVRNIDDPVASAGPDQAVNERVLVTLTGSASDPDGSITGYAWVQTSGVGVTLSGANSASASFTAPSVNSDALLTFQLTVTDNSGRVGTDSVAITVRNVLIPPTANAGVDLAVDMGSPVILDGRASADSDGSIAGYVWTQTAGPNVSLSGVGTARPTFNAPIVSVDTVLTFSLTVTDNDGLAASDTVNVTVRRVNIPPNASAGPDQTINERTAVTLDGSASNDPDGGSLSYQWTQLLGPAVTLSSSSAVRPTFTAPSVTSDTVVRFSLQVTDSDGGATGTDTVDITVVNVDPPPTANAGPDQTVYGAATVQLSGSGTFADGTITQYLWTQLAGPSVTLSGATSPNASFVAPDISSTTTLQFQLQVTTNTGLTAQDAVTITILDREADTDVDGLPDGWETQNFGNITSQGAGGDPDADGLTNLQEYQSGSSPVAANGAPTVATVATTQRGDTDTVISFGNVVAATRYDIYWSTSASVSKATGTKIANVTSPYVHFGRTNGTTYYYIVVAGNVNGDGPVSSTVSAKPGLRTWGSAPAVAVPSIGESPDYQIVRDSNGNALIAYFFAQTGSAPKLYSARYSASGVWSAPVLMTTLANAQIPQNARLRLAMNAGGDAAAIWTHNDGARFNLWSSYLPAGATSWQAPQLVETYNGGPNEQGDIGDTDVSIGDKGLIAAVWTQQEIRSYPGVQWTVRSTYASVRKASQSWSPRRLIEQTDVGTSEGVQVSVDGANGALFAWTRTNCPQGSGSCGGAASWLGARYMAGAWQGPAVLYTTPTYQGVPAQVQIGSDAAGNGLVVYRTVGPAITGNSFPEYARASKFRLSGGWDGTATLISTATTTVSSLRMAVKRDGRAIAAWSQSSNLNGNQMSSAGTWAGIKSMTKISSVSGLVPDSLGRGLALLLVTAQANTDVYSSTISTSGWTTKVLVENLTPVASKGDLAGDDFGNAIGIWQANGQFLSNTYIVR